MLTYQVCHGNDGRESVNLPELLVVINGFVCGMLSACAGCLDNEVNMQANEPLDPLTDVIEVMDRLRSPGGCPWDLEQTHESLVKYLLEESHEFAHAVEVGDRAEMREELGDVLLQVLFHARVAQEHPTDPFDISNVARALAAKLRFRHPHVFAGLAVADTAEVSRNWDALKAQEKQRLSILEGIPKAQGALARTQKVLGRISKNERLANRVEVLPKNIDNSSDAEKIGFELLQLVQRAQRAGVDAEGALRQTLSGLENSVVRAEHDQQ